MPNAIGIYFYIPLTVTIKRSRLWYVVFGKQVIKCFCKKIIDLFTVVARISLQLRE